jgi:hypothetical protein
MHNALHKALLLDCHLRLELPDLRLILILFIFFLYDFFSLYFLAWGILTLLAAA